MDGGLAACRIAPRFCNLPKIHGRIFGSATYAAMEGRTKCVASKEAMEPKLEHSYFSKLKTTWAWRRTVTMHFEDKTEEVCRWAQTMDRRTFNEQLEAWYNER